MSHHDVTMLFLSLAILLGTARLLGEIARRLQQPAVVGEILAGLLLGPTVMGRIAPHLQQSLFPTEGALAIALQSLFTVAVALFLVVAGLEVDLSVAFRQGKTTLVNAVTGMVLPFVLGFAVAAAVPELLMENPGKEFPLFFGVALCISALPVIAKILKDLNLLKTDIGVIVIASATVNDLIGWILFAIVLGSVTTTQGFSIPMVIALTLAFVFVMLTAGRWTIHKFLPWLQAHTSWPAGVMGFGMAGAFLCASFTEHIGIHAIFGAFIFGVALGDSSHLRERTRTTLDQFISFIFAPIFFASIGLKVDFISNFSLVPVVLVLVIATVGKIAGCYIGGIMTGLSKRESMAIGVAKNARGAMEIILGLLALQAGVIDEKMFVALVIMALLTSMTSGWLMERVLKRPRPVSFVDMLSPKGYIAGLEAADRQEAIAQLSRAASGILGIEPVRIYQKVWERESTLSTGLPNYVAIPHARMEELDRPVLILGRSRDGVDFDSPDGHAARLIFLILTPQKDPSSQLEILAGIAALANRPERVESLLRTESFTQLLAQLKAIDE